MTGANLRGALPSGRRSGGTGDGDVGVLTVREYRDQDEHEALALMAAALGWKAAEPHRDFFLWKHHQSPYGRSPAWVAVDGDRIVGFRTFMRWEFVRDGQVVRAARAVDTATHPDAQGKGVFRTLTLHALDALRSDGVRFVFNTPNDNSRPGYLKMGWQPVGQLPLAVRLGRLAAAPLLARSRVPAERWSEPSGAGRPATEVLAQPGVERLLGEGRPGVLRTRRTREFLRWRYGFGPLHYRAVLAGADVEDGVVLFRVRRRGAAREAAIADVLLPPGRSSRGLVRSVLRESRADYAVALRPAPAGMLAVPGQGPLLVWRAVADDRQPPAQAWDLALGDIELF